MLHAHAGFAAEIAKAAQGKYFYLPNATDAGIASKRKDLSIGANSFKTDFDPKNLLRLLFVLLFKYYSLKQPSTVARDKCVYHAAWSTQHLAHMVLYSPTVPRPLPPAVAASASLAAAKAGL